MGSARQELTEDAEPPLSLTQEEASDPQSPRAECERLLAHPLFALSKRYSGLLKYIVDHTLEGRHECLKERIIGIEVFGRPATYHTGDDASVRVAITEVRKRLTRYYEDPAHRHGLQIRLPPGSYVATFVPDHPVPALTAPLLDQALAPQEHIAPAPQRHFLVRRPLVISMLVLVLLLACWAASRLLSPTSTIDAFWAPLLKSRQPVIILLGTPEGNWSTPSAETARNGSIPQPTLSGFISRQPNFPIAELSAADSISSFLAKSGTHTAVRLARSTSLADLRETPGIVLGASSNDWAVRFGSGLHFRFCQSENPIIHWIQDAAHPENTSWSVNVDAPLDQVKHEYALVTRAVDPTTGQWWVGFGGMTVLGTLGAQQLLTDPVAITGMSGQLPKGWQRKNMQIVVQFEMVNGSLGTARVVGSYFW